MPLMAVRLSERSEPARVALVGYGLAGAAFHAPLLEAVRGLDLAAIVTRDEGRRAAARRAHPGAELLESADEVWERAASFDLVVVAAPNRAHVPLARASIAAGLAVVVDKPLAPSAAAARELVDEARERAVMLTVFQNRRWDGDFLTARRLIEAGELGSVLRFESRFERWRPEIKEGWREEADPEEAGGVLFDLGSHLVDQALQLFGPVRDLHAEVDCRRPGARVDDDSFVALEHESGVRSHLWMSAVAADVGPRLRVLGDRAAYVKHGLDVQEEALRSGERPGGPAWGEEPETSWGRLGAGDDFRPVPTEPGDYTRFYEDVARALREGGPPPVDPEDAVRVLELLDEARAVRPRERSPTRPSQP
jgi:predicted dehydrogenase